jgi:hydroxypyruvate reductase
MPTPESRTSADQPIFIARRHLDIIRQAGIDAASAELAVSRNLTLLQGVLSAGHQQIELHPDGKIFVIAFGKASAGMCRAAAAILGTRLATGVAAVPGNDQNGIPEEFRAIAAGHPLPDEGSLLAGELTEELLHDTAAEDLVLALISGGGSSMMELPLPGIRLDDLKQLNRLLLDSGAPIQEINTVRKAISRIKGGGLARLAAPAKVISLILSDVVGDRIAAIASGPTVLTEQGKRGKGSAVQSQAIAVLQEYALWKRIPMSVRRALQRDPPRRRHAKRPLNIIIGNNRMVVDAADRQARDLGYATRVLSYRMQGEARDIGARIGQRVVEAKPGTCLLWGGETTVTVTGAGKGGRNQELALAGAVKMQSKRGAFLMSLATDGVDGPTDAAGAVVSGETASKARALGFQPEQALAHNDAYPLLQAVGALIQTGPTGTNLMDLVVGLRI